MSDTFKPGDIYLDCSYHPVFCTKATDDGLGGFDLSGISLLDGSAPRFCPTRRCGAPKITAEEAELIHDFVTLEERAERKISGFYPTWTVTNILNRVYGEGHRGEHSECKECAFLKIYIDK
ncbi:MAG: hypothetical protein R3346_00745 [Candidatus Spechtbacterales bacterium]|nr:hypothetical protein [Candidatus Spechtbacterales bacterium]